MLSAQDAQENCENEPIVAMTYETRFLIIAERLDSLNISRYSLFPQNKS